MREWQALVSLQICANLPEPILLTDAIRTKARALAHMGLDATKPVFGVSDKARLKPVSLATETSYIIEILLEASLDDTFQ